MLVSPYICNAGLTCYMTKIFVNTEHMNNVSMQSIFFFDDVLEHIIKYLPHDKTVETSKNLICIE